VTLRLRRTPAAPHTGIARVPSYPYGWNHYPPGLAALPARTFFHFLNVASLCSQGRTFFIRSAAERAGTVSAGWPVIQASIAILVSTCQFSREEAVKRQIEHVTSAILWKKGTIKRILWELREEELLTCCMSDRIPEKKGELMFSPSQKTKWGEMKFLQDYIYCLSSCAVD